MTLHDPPFDIPTFEAYVEIDGRKIPVKLNMSRAWIEWFILSKQDKMDRVEGGTEDNIVILDSIGQPKDSSTSLPGGTLADTSTAQQLANKTFAELITTKILASNGSGGLQETDLSGWVAGVAGRITITDDGDGTITITVPLKAANGLDSDANGLLVKLKSGFGIIVDADGLQLKQQSNIADASAVSSISAGAGSDTIDLSTFNTDLGTLVTEINAIKGVVNYILALLLAAELMAAP